MVVENVYHRPLKVCVAKCVSSILFLPHPVCDCLSPSVGGEVDLQGQPGACLSPSEEPPPRQRVEEQQRYVECLRQEIQAEQGRAERELEREQAHLLQQHTESEYTL